ncbi:MAG: phosphatidylcholine synthase [Hyphomicrobiaceae bacterium]|nr:phosphatidylcholine synthase [Hyphomicrobiaceae bacterium]
MSPFLRAAAVHAFTASGVVCGLLALLAAFEKRFEVAFLWLGLAMVIDGIDGTFARLADVKRHAPHVSGETLDLCVDYVTYVLVPVVMLMSGGYLVGAGGLVLAALILMSSLYHFSDTGSKSDDHCFVGFPAIWNIVAFYVFALGLPGWGVAVLVVVLSTLTFVRIKFVHPMRVETLKLVTLTACVVWGMAAMAATLNGLPASWPLAAVLVAVAGYGIGLSAKFGMDGRSKNH